MNEWEKARELLGLNKSEMARALVVAKGTYYKWENGHQSAPAVAHAARRMLVQMKRYAPAALTMWYEMNGVRK